MAEEVGFEPTERVQAAQTISSRSRYDHFDTPPYSVFDVLSEKGENYTRELVIFRKRALRFLPVTTGFFSGQPSSKAMAFRVLHLRPLGQLSVSIFVRFSFQKFAQKFVGEKTGETAKNIRF